MIRKLAIATIAIIFAALGFYLGLYLSVFGILDPVPYFPQLKYGIIGLTTLIGGLMGVFLAPGIIKKALVFADFFEQILHKTPTYDIISGSVGLIIGLIIANLLASTLEFIPFIGDLIGILLTFLLGFLGLSVGVKKREEIVNIFASLPRFGKEKGKGENKSHLSLKILDTSVIIDGRIAEIYESGFVEGTLVVPSFVLEELRHIADSSDLLKRNRGRRGLEILNKMRKDFGNKLHIHEDQKGLEDAVDVDSKLVKLCQLLNAKILTNDYNLNRVSELQGVKVLNINELANAIKPVVLPGEEMSVQIIKDGKEIGQGVAYLDDGTMIVVDGGKKHIGETINVIVTSVLQTAAGRMIFAKPKDKKGVEHLDNNNLNGVNALG